MREVLDQYREAQPLTLVSPDSVNFARERLGEGVDRCHCACGVIAAPTYES